MQRLVLATSRPPLDRAWAVGYRMLARGAGHLLTLGCAPRATVYARGSTASGELVPGISDIDLVVVPDRSTDAARVHRRWEQLRDRTPFVTHLVDRPRVQTVAELTAVAGRSPFTFGLASGGAPDAAIGAARGTALLDRNRALERPDGDGPARWSRVAGPPRPLPTVSPDDQAHRIAAWLELVHLWKRAYGALVDPSPPHTTRLCTKLVTIPVGVLAGLHGEPEPAGAACFDRAAALAPGLAEAVERVARASHEARRLPRPPVDDAVDLLAALTALVADALAEAVASARRTEVELRGRSEVGLPLCDWQALVRPGEGVEAFTPRRAPLCALSVRAALAADGRLAGVVHGPLVAFPSPRRSRVALRAVSCAPVDPVSFALLAGRDDASFVELDGWSIDHWARRAVAERRHETQARPGAPDLRTTVAAARAELLRLSVAEGAPLLTTTDAATLALLVERDVLGERAASTCGGQLAAGPVGPPPDELVRAVDRLRAQP